MRAKLIGDETDCAWAQARAKLLSAEERTVLEFLATQEPQEQQPQLIVGMRRLATLAESIRKKCRATAACAV